MVKKIFAQAMGGLTPSTSLATPLLERGQFGPKF